MFSEMHHKDIIDSWIGFICGVAGGGLHLLNVQFSPMALAQAIITAFFCGAAGVAGRHILNYFIKKFRKKTY